MLVFSYIPIKFSFEIICSVSPRKSNRNREKIQHILKCKFVTVKTKIFIRFKITSFNS